MAKNKKPKEVNPSEQINTKFGEMLEAIVEAGDAAKWEEHSSNFDPENKESIEDALKYYGGLLDKANKKMQELRNKVLEVFPN